MLTFIYADENMSVWRESNSSYILPVLEGECPALIAVRTWGVAKNQPESQSGKTSWGKAPT